MLAHRFAIELMVRAGLPTAHVERIVGDGQRSEVARVRITDAGLRILAKGLA